MSEERYRLVVLGSPKVGKTSLIRKYLYNEFSDKYKETVEDLHSRQFRIQGVPLPLDILDTNFNFPDMRKVAISSASAFLLVFAVDDVQSFKEMSDLWNEICERRTDVRLLPTVVAGNKTDLESKKIFEATATAWTSRLSSDVRYIECSAKTSYNVVEIFKNLLDISGFPRCKATGGFLGNVSDTSDEGSDAHGHKGNSGTCKSQATKVEGHARQEREHRLSPSAHEAQHATPSSPSTLILPAVSAGELKRNRSLRMKHMEKKEPLERRPSDEGSKGLGRSSSIIRRTKHLSLKIKRYNERPPEEEVVDESDCRIS